MQKNYKELQMNVLTNTKALHDYEILETHQAGIVLHGWEVKALRANRITFGSPYVHVSKEGEMFMLGLNITPLPTTGVNQLGFCTRTTLAELISRKKKLLMKRSEIDRLSGLVQQNRLTIVPLGIFWADNRKLKVKIALCKGKNAADKRQASKDRDWKLEQNRLMKQSTKE